MRSYAKGNIIAVDGKAIRSTGKSDNSYGTLQILSPILTDERGQYSSGEIKLEHPKKNEEKKMVNAV